MASALSALTYLQDPGPYVPTPCCIVHGTDSFLKRETIATIRRSLFGTEPDADLSVTVLNGPDTEFRDLRDALGTPSLFGSATRLIVVELADPFVSAHRNELETHLAVPSRDAVLILEVTSWPSNTRLAKQLAADKALVIDCGPPDPKGTMPATACRLVREWLIRWAADRYQLALKPTVADAILEAVALAPGILDQELAKLVGQVGDDRRVTLDLVRSAVGNWRNRTVWEMVDAVLDGRATDALGQLDRLLTAGEAPEAILPMLASSIRRLTVAGRLITDAERIGNRLPIGTALKQAGIAPFKLRQAEQQLRNLGRRRADQCLQWLLDADLAIKGSHSSGEGPRFVLEQIILRFGKPFR